MLLNFTVSNYRSIRDEVSLTTLATRLDPERGIPVEVADDGTKVNVLPVLAILGANASGKSNILRAMSTMRSIILNSASTPRYQTDSKESPTWVEPFLLDPKYADKPTLMHMEFVISGVRYQYGFEIFRGRVKEEWLHTFPHKRTQVLFDREDTKEFQIGKNLGGRARVISEITRPQVLFLSAAANAGHPLLSKIYNFFLRNLHLLDVRGRGEIDSSLIQRIMDRYEQSIKLLELADLGISDAIVENNKVSPEDFEDRRNMFRDLVPYPDGMSEEEKEVELDRIVNATLADQFKFELLHQGSQGLMPLPYEDESHGTKSWLSFVTHALEALANGAVLLVDELDASLHPLLLAEALRMFQSPKANVLGAQLIFTTHDVTLLGGDRGALEQYNLSRGQVWMVEKGRRGESSLTPLSDYRPRKGEDIQRGYLQGRYGGTPSIKSSISADVVRESTGVVRGNTVVGRGNTGVVRGSSHG
ncbi:AAA15 family ATPase/GTPase [Arthrobacter pascens]|uniref:AAA family ATPase n=1 Tax=Arthrobacter pascens TaxID=1677 RepID=UPI00285C6DFA|nr:ATP-binding protein [Arthrobacter pascens]MDR6558186.1 AAA15 family ATPase/GTPase [Arthrobacter pascens]